MSKVVEGSEVGDTMKSGEVEEDSKQEMYDRLERFVEHIENCPHRFGKGDSYKCSLLEYDRCGFLRCPEI